MANKPMATKTGGDSELTGYNRSTNVFHGEWVKRVLFDYAVDHAKLTFQMLYHNGGGHFDAPTNEASLPSTAPRLTLHGRKFAELHASSAAVPQNSTTTNAGASATSTRVKVQKFHFPDYFDKKLEGRNGFAPFSQNAKKHVDLVLVYHRKADNGQQERRQFFQENMVTEGFELEMQEISFYNSALCFVLVHAPTRLLLRYAERWQLKVPLQSEPLLHVSTDLGQGSLSCVRWLQRCLMRFDDGTLELDSSTSIKWPFKAANVAKYAIKNSRWLSESDRLFVVWNVLLNLRTRRDNSNKRGIENLLKHKVYDQAYPLHDGDLDDLQKPNAVPNPQSVRILLRENWGTLRRIFSGQPLSVICDYFGHKIAFYFSFFGFYTRLLTVPAAMGIVATLYGITTAMNHQVVEELCDRHVSPGNRTMCPICKPPKCELWILAEEGCMRSRWNFVMDNEATLFVACFIIVWATACLKMWKRTENVLALEWGTFDMEPRDIVRPAYLAKATLRRTNPVTLQTESYVSFWYRFKYRCFSVAVTLLMLTCSAAAVISLTILRVRLYGEFREMGGFFETYHIEFARWSVHGYILMVVFIFDKIYTFICAKLTEMECPKTEMEYYHSFVWKVLIFSLVNDFIPIFYAAFFKRLHVRTPLDLSIHNELCDPGGCIVEVTELIAVLLLMRWIVEDTIDASFTLISKFRHKKTLKQEPWRNAMPMWLKDYMIGDYFHHHGIEEQHLKAIVQFAYCTLFVPAFPLAPLVCLLNNVVKLRLKAKALLYHRRPIPRRVRGIGVWNNFLHGVLRAAVITNAAFMAFTSDLIPRLYYRHLYSPDGTLAGYVQFSSSRVFTSQWRSYGREFANLTTCWYRDFRDNQPPYDVTDIWWELYAVRLSVFILFTCFFNLFIWVVDSAVPNVPRWAKKKIKRNTYFAEQILDKHRF